MDRLKQHFGNLFISVDDNYQRSKIAADEAKKLSIGFQNWVSNNCVKAGTNEWVYNNIPTALNTEQLFTKFLETKQF